MAAVWPNITVNPWTPLTGAGLLVRTAHKAAYSVIQSQDPRWFSPAYPGPAADPDAPVGSAAIVGATDASISVGTRHGVPKIAGWAWITSTGTHRCGTFETGTILGGEIYAIKALLEGTPQDRQLVVLTDSIGARDVVRDLQAGTAPASLTFAGSLRMRPVLRTIRDLLEGRQVDVRWVRGHSGHPLNEGADRLARQARRSAEHDLPNEVGAAITKRIVAETRALLPALVSRAA
jgi:ribonuclease HI